MGQSRFELSAGLKRCTVLEFEGNPSNIRIRIRERSPLAEMFNESLRVAQQQYTDKTGGHETPKKQN